MRKTIAQIKEEAILNMGNNFYSIEEIGLNEASKLSGGDREYKPIIDTPTENVSWGTPSFLFDIFR